MKRIQAACICQTLRFALPDGTEAANAAELMRQEAEQYKKGLEEKHIRHRIVSEQAEPDGSVVLKIIKQYNTSPVGDYLN